MSAASLLICLDDPARLPLTERGQELLRDFRIAYELRIVPPTLAPEPLETLLRSFEASGGQIVLCLASTPTYFVARVAALSHLPLLAVSTLAEDRLRPSYEPFASFAGGEEGFSQALRFAMQVLALGQPDLARELRYQRLGDRAKAEELDLLHKVQFDA